MDSLRISLLTLEDPLVPTVRNEGVVRYLINHKRQAHRVDGGLDYGDGSKNIESHASFATNGVADANVCTNVVDNRLMTLVPSLGCIIYHSGGNDVHDDADNDGGETILRDSNSFCTTTPTRATTAFERKRKIAATSESRKQRFPGGKRSRTKTISTTAPSPQKPLSYVIPPYEYCSVAMINHLRLGRKADRALTDKGGTIKNILQSNKSFIHYLITYPLKNTFRGYIQISPYLAPRHVALPYHQATQLFSIDVERDAENLHFRPTGATCASARCYNRRRFDVSLLERKNSYVEEATSDIIQNTAIASIASPTTQRCECELWPNDNYHFYFDTTRNFSLVLKRDPCIHNGSIVGITRVYVYKRGVEYNDSIYISPFILKHLNADFDGDAVTIMIIRGIESSCELDECLRDPMLFGTIPRFTFCQSMVFWIFRMLAFDDEHDERRALLRYGESKGSFLAPRAASALLHERTNLWRSRGARRRARRVFGCWYRNYKRVLLDAWNVTKGKTAAKWHYFEKDTSDWSVPVWRQRAILDRVYVNAVWEKTQMLTKRNDTAALSQPQRRDPREIFETMHRRILDYRMQNRNRSIRSCIDRNSDGRIDQSSHTNVPIDMTIDDTIVLLDREIFCLENWMIVHSGAKATPRDLWSLHERYAEHNHDSLSPWTTSSTIAGSENNNSEKHDFPYADFFRECLDEKEQEYMRYLDDFVVISKHVPKSSYFASGLKWVTQMCSVTNGDLYMQNKLLLRDIAYYFKATFGTM